MSTQQPAEQLTDLVSVSLAGERTHHQRDKMSLPLHFPVESIAILTKFRKDVLTCIFRAAQDLSGGLLASGIVSVSSSPDEDDSLHLYLTLTFNADWDTLDKWHDRILEKLGEWAQEWSQEEQEDYSRWIYFGLFPSQL